MIREDELEMVKRHVREGEAAVLRQAAIVAELEAAGHDAAMAETLLQSFEDIQMKHVTHLARLIQRDRK